MYLVLRAVCDLLMSQFNKKTRSELDKLNFTSNESKSIVAAIKSEFAELRNEFSKMKDYLTGIINDKNEEIASLSLKNQGLENDLKCLSGKVAKLEEEIDSADAYERRDTLIFAGSVVPPSAAGENCAATVSQLLKDKLRLEISAADISVAHRMGPKPLSQGVDRRKLIAKFCRRDVKRDILQSSRRSKVEGMFVSESLTPTRSKIHRALRAMRRLHPEVVKGCTTQDGRVYVFTPSATANFGRDRKHLIPTLSKLEEFCQEYLQVTSETFLDHNRRQ